MTVSLKLPLMTMGNVSIAKKTQNQTINLSQS